jgi:ABC-2 type transport system permease protein
MTRLTKVELRRLFARRLTQIGVIAALLIAGALLVGTWQSAKPLSAVEEQQAQVSFDQAHRDWEQTHVEQSRSCREGWATQPEPRPPIDEACAYPEPKREQFGKPPTDFREVMPDLLQGAAYLLAFIGFVIGASFVGAEFSTGAIGNWLTFEPRRLRVYASKLLAVMIGLLPVSVGVVGVLLAGTWLITDHYGGTSGTTSGTWADLAGTAGRAVALTAVAAAMGSVVALLLRHTAAAIGLAMAYLVLIEGVFGGLLTRAQPYLLSLNFDAWIKHDTTYYVDDCEMAPDGSYYCNGIEKVLSFEHSAWYLGILAVVLAVAGGLVFRRRDVT